MKSKKFWLILVLIVLAGAAFFFWNSLAPFLPSAIAGGTGGGRRGADSPAAQSPQTVAIRPAADVNQVSAAGNIALAHQQSVVLQVEGAITEIAVEPGDTVAKGDLLLSLDSDDLERAVERAALGLAVTQNQLAQLHEPADKAEVKAAEAGLAAAKENLAELQAGPSAAELEAAQVTLAAAQESYQAVLDGQSEAEITQLSAELHKAFLTLEQAQEAYNAISYRGDIGGTQQAMTLQEATIDYDTAKAALEVSTAAATPAEIQAALKTIKEAQVQLEALSPTRAELSAAEAEVVQAEATLATALASPSQGEVEAAELAIEQAQLDLQEVQANLERAQLRAPAAGTILTVDATVGQRATAGLSVLTMANLTDLELPVYVAEVDIRKVEIGQPVGIAIDALPNQHFNGEVSRIAPLSQSESGVVNYQVTVQLKDLDLADGVRPGMTAVATTRGDSAENAWLVPSNAVVEFEGETTVRVIRNGREQHITVTAGAPEGEWTVVQSDELQAGDEVVGQVASFVDEDNGFQGPRGPFGPPPGRP